MKRCRVILWSGLVSGLAGSLLARSQPPTCEVITANQIGEDGRHTAVIQKRLDDCGERNYKQVSVELSPAYGASFTSGPLFIPNHVVLWLDAGVTLHASTNPTDYQRTRDPRAPAGEEQGAIPNCGALHTNQNGCVGLINSRHTTDVGVGGPGMIEGHGWSRLTGETNSGFTWWELAGNAQRWKKVKFVNSPRIIDFSDVTNVSLSDFTILNAPLYHVMLNHVTEATITGIKILTPTLDHAAGFFPYNSDGLSVIASRHVLIDGVDIACGDDNIVINSERGDSSSDITVTNSILREGYGLAIGVDTSGGITNVDVKNLRILRAVNGLHIKSDKSEGGLVDEISFSTVCIFGVQHPIFITPYDNSKPGDLPPMFRKVQISGLYADGGSLTLKGYFGQPPLELTLNNVRIDKPKKISAANVIVTQISDPGYVFPIPLHSGGDVTVVQSQAPASDPVDMKSYCQSVRTQDIPMPAGVPSR